LSDGGERTPDVRAVVPRRGRDGRLVLPHHRVELPHHLRELVGALPPKRRAPGADVRRTAPAFPIAQPVHVVASFAMAASFFTLALFASLGRTRTARRRATCPSPVATTISSCTGSTATLQLVFVGGKPRPALLNQIRSDTVFTP